LDGVGFLEGGRWFGLFLLLEDGKGEGAGCSIGKKGIR